MRQWQQILEIREKQLGQSTSTEREKFYVKRGKLQLVDAYQGEEQNGDKPGRGAENKVSIVVARFLRGAELVT